MWARTLLRGAADFVYPPACRLCGGELPDRPADGIGPAFCAPCAAALLADRGTACRQCGATIGPGLDPKLPCAFCHDENYTFDRVIRLGVYDGPLRSACLAIKKPESESLAAGLAELTWQVEKERFAQTECDVVIPIPRFWVQRFTQAHHAADTLAEVWAKRLQVPLASHILRKVRWTRPQARLTPSERRVNLRRAFATVGVDALAGASVVLAVDVMTSGATVQEATRQLRRAGAARVVVAVVARGLGRQVSQGSRS
jgi:predicted amidophosphoribosyltransferase